MPAGKPAPKNPLGCPIPKTHRRLTQAHVLWHQALRSYLNPAIFLANLNATIESLRNVTFVLQNEKHSFAKFDEWYGPWQARLKGDKTSTWLHEARTRVVHQGDLESRSTAEVKLVTYKNEVIANLVVPINLVSERILEHDDVSKFLSEYQNDDTRDQAAVVAVERSWRADGLAFKTQYALERSPRSKPIVSCPLKMFLPIVCIVLIFCIAGLLFIVPRARLTLGAYRIPWETGLLIPSVP